MTIKVSWDERAAALWETKKAIKYYKALEESQLANLVELSGGQSAIGEKFELMIDQRPGSVDYSKVPELQGVILEPYRKDPVTVCRLVERILKPLV